ncbi:MULTISPECIES: hypothetical protein [unclassified Streptomyces]|uniref:hypothetical protein n=1 Tax=unclassified Streptomyces TaxID=2593676 RepID=UPI0033B04FF1
MMMSRRPPAEPSLLVALWWLLLAAVALVMFLGGINFLFSLNDEPTPLPTVTVTETQDAAPDLSDDMPSSVTDDDLAGGPTPSVCVNARDQGVVPLDPLRPVARVL